MNLNKFTVILAILLVSILAMGAVSAETVDDSDIAAATGDDIQESVDVTDAAEGLSSADVADETVGDDNSGPDDTVSYDLDDDTYSTYFNEDGTATDELSADGNYYLNVGTLTNKDIKIVSGKNIYIEGKEGSGIITNGTITIGEGVANQLDTLQISGITFINSNKNPIVVNQYAKNIGIARNNFDLTYDDTYTDNAIAIITKGLVDEVDIVGNDIKMTSATSYTYGLDLTYYLDWYNYADGNAKNFFIADNTIDIESTAVTGMAEAMYLDSIINSVIEGNTINVVTDNAGVAAYGMQVSDSWGFLNDPWASSAYNVTINDNTIVLDINDNTIVLDAADLAYGISAISLWSYTEDYDPIVKDMVISGNDVTITTQTEGVGISASSNDVSIIDNKVTLNAAHDPVQAYTDGYIGNISYAIFVNNFNKDMGNFVNNTVTGNTIVSNVQGIKTTKEDDDVQPLTIENNNIAYNVDDDSYATFFNEDGTAKDVLNPLGDYALIIGTLNNKDLVIASGSNINITVSETEGIINGGTITIGDGAGSAGSIIISGLTFTNTNKNAIVINQYSTKVTVDGNKFNLTYDDTYTDSAIAVFTKGFVDETTIANNVINMESAASYTYGLDLAYYLDWYTAGDANGQHFNVANNDINIHSTAATGMAEAMYLDSIINSVIEGNTINVVTDNAGVAAYGMQVSDSWGFLNDPWASSAYNVTINDNTIVLDGISAISLYPYDEDNEKIVKDMVISGNELTITTQTEGVGISASSNDVSITDNKVTLNAAHNPVQAYTDGYIGNVSYGILVNNFNSDMGNFVNNTVTGNTIVSNVQAIKAAKEDDDVQPLTIEDNEVLASILIDDETYDTYFNADGTIKEDSPIYDANVLLIGNLTGKKLVIDTSLTIRGLSDKKLVNTTINLVYGADNSVIEDLDIEFTGDETTGSIGIIYIKEVTNVTIQNNKIVVPDFVDKTGAKYGSSVYAIEVESGASGAHDISINNNNISILGSNRYIYGIDVFKTWGSENRNNNINIFENIVNINGGSKMAEGIYVSESDDVIINGNTIDSTSNGAAYGVATDQLTNAVIASNIINVDAATQSYGITATTSGTDTIIRANTIDAKGIGALGIGFNHQNGITIEDNTISVDGGDYTTITSSDSLGTATAAIFDAGNNTDVTTNGNVIDEFFGVKLECSDLTVTAAPNGEGTFKVTLTTVDGAPLADKEITLFFNNEILKVTTDENGVAELSFDLNKAGKYPVSIAFLGDKHYNGAFTTATITIDPIKTSVTSAAKTYLATASSKTLTATLKDANGNVLANKKVTFTVNGKTYTATTNANAKGVATVKLALTAAKTYTVTIKFAGDNVYAASTVSAKVKLNKEKTKVTAPKKTFKRSKKVKKVVITLKNSKGKAVAKKKITLTVNKKKYTAKTNKKGKATIKVKLTKKGTFKYKVKFAGDTQYKAAKKNGKIKIK